MTKKKTVEAPIVATPTKAKRKYVRKPKEASTTCCVESEVETLKLDDSYETLSVLMDAGIINGKNSKDFECVFPILKYARYTINTLRISVISLVSFLVYFFFTH